MHTTESSKNVAHHLGAMRYFMCYDHCTSAATFLLEHGHILACAHFGCHLLFGISIALSKKFGNP